MQPNLLFLDQVYFCHKAFKRDCIDDAYCDSVTAKLMSRHKVCLLIQFVPYDVIIVMLCRKILNLKTLENPVIGLCSLLTFGRSSVIIGLLTG